MASQQEFQVSPPLETDKETLQDFSEIIQRNLQKLFELAHEHRTRDSEPKAKDLDIGIPIVVNLSGTYYLYVKINDTQLARTALTVI